MLVEEVVKYDKWFSDIIQKDVYSLNLNENFINKIANIHSEENLYITNLLKKEVFIYTKILPDEVNKIKLIENFGFHLIDTNIVFLKNISPANFIHPSIEIMNASPEDEEQTVNLAKESFTYSRFHLDPLFSKDMADHLKGEWVRNYFKGHRGIAMILAKIESKVVGFLQLLKSKDAIIIDLIAVEKNQRGKKIAASMIGFAEKKFAGEAQNIVVGTQLANWLSIHLYQNIGFKLHQAKYVFHFHNQADKT